MGAPLKKDDGLVEDVLEELRGHLAENLGAVRDAVHETEGKVAQKLTLGLTFKLVEEDLVMEVAPSLALKGEPSTRKASIAGKQLKLL